MSDMQKDDTATDKSLPSHAKVVVIGGGVVGFWCAEPCHYRLSDQICFVTEKQSADVAALTWPRFKVTYFQNEILAMRGQ